MDERDIAVRRLTYGTFVELGRAPTAEEVAVRAGSDAAAVRAASKRLHDEHALVIDPATGQITMLNPFSAVPTAFRVEAAGRTWYGNCAWDAIGICAALHVDGRVETACPDCGEPLEVAIENERPSDETLLFHCLVPARHWWDDIVFT